MASFDKKLGQVTFLGQEKSINVPTQIQHWQLTDLIHCPVDRNVVYSAFQNGIQRSVLNEGDSPAAEEDQVKVILECDYSPTCFACSENFIVTGGSSGQLTAAKLESGEVFYSHLIGGLINNAVHIAKFPSGHYVYVANNDETVRVLSLTGGMRQLATVPFSTRVNACAVSPDLRYFAAVGDSSGVFLHSVARDGYTFSDGKTISADKSGVSVAWHPDGNLFATAHQDGCLANVWDVRQLARPLACVRSLGNADSDGAGRQVKFAKTATCDLLFYAEHRKVVHVVDARSFATEQTLLVSAHAHGNETSGLAVAPDDSRLYVGTLERILYYPIASAARRCFPFGELL